MDNEMKILIEAKNQWESDIKMYKEYLKGETQTFEGKYGAEEYISMAENRLNDINIKLKKLETKVKKDFYAG